MVLTGDVHVGYAFDIKEDFDDPASRTVGTEIVATSIASGKDGAEKPANWDNLTRANPHMKFYNGRRGYVTVTLGQRAGARRLPDGVRGHHARCAGRHGRVLRDRGRQPGAHPLTLDPADRGPDARRSRTGRRAVVRRVADADRGHVPRRASASRRANPPAAPAATPSRRPAGRASPRPPRTACPKGPAGPGP